LVVFHSRAKILSAGTNLPLLLGSQNKNYTPRIDFGQEDFCVKRLSGLAILTAATSLTSLLGCGGAAIGKLQAINLTSTATSSGGFDLKGEGGTIQRGAIGIYTSTDARDLSTHVTYTATPTGNDLSGMTLPNPPQTITVSSTGLVTAVTPFVCTWTNVGTSTQPAYQLTGSYKIVASIQGVTSQPIYVGVASQGGDGPSGACGP
jgi:hypothetical protein